ncbi:MAG: hypothetical protein F4X36_16055, partial [Gammaproteobacteria bacterium]|nr:hypothetical protein [Gammaproteobacteria bacterium]
MILAYFGTLPKPVLTMVRWWAQDVGVDRVQGLCSGSLRQEQAIRVARPGASIRANDVTMLSVALGRFARGDDHAGITFKRDLAPLNDAKSRMLAAACVHKSLKGRRLRLPLTGAQIESILSTVEDSYAEHRAAADGVRLDGFDECDFRDLLNRPGAVVGFPPTFVGQYEKDARRVADRCDWGPPNYKTWDPDQFPDVCRQVHERGEPWLLGAERLYDGLPLLSIHANPPNRTVYVYGHPDTRLINTDTTPRLRWFPRTIDPAR